MRGWQRGIGVLDAVLRGLAALVLALVVALVVWSAVGRYLFESPGRFIEELTGLLMVALLFLALASPGREGHMRLGLLADRMRGGARLAFRIAALLIVLLFVVIFAWDAAEQTLFNLQRGIKTELAGFLIWPWTLMMPLGLAILGLRAVIAFVSGQVDAATPRDGT